MNANIPSSDHPTRRAIGLFFGHVGAVVLGLVLMIAGLGMGVTIVLLPIGVPVGLAGLFLFLWGLFVYSKKKQAAGADRVSNGPSDAP